MQSSLHWERPIVFMYGNPVKMETLVSHYRTDSIIYPLFSHFLPFYPHLGLWILSHPSSVAQAHSCLPGGQGTSGYLRLGKMVVTNWFDIWWNVCNVSFPPAAEGLAACSDKQDPQLRCTFSSCNVRLYLIWELCLCQHCLCSSADITFPSKLNYYWTLWSYPMRKVFVY